MSSLLHVAVPLMSSLLCVAIPLMSAQMNPKGPTYRWDQIHEMILSHSPNTSLVIVNLPDPPDMHAIPDAQRQMEVCTSRA